MSIQDFDNLTTALADRAISRRRALQMAAASVLGAAALGLAAGEAQATHGECARRGAGCCRDGSHDGSKGCRCIRTASGKRRCVHPCCAPNDTIPRACNSNAECDDNELCMSSDCCNDQSVGFVGVCARRCDTPRDFTCGQPFPSC